VTHLYTACRLTAGVLPFIDDQALPPQAFGGPVRRQPTKRFRTFQAVAERKLQMIDIAWRTDALRIPPANRLEALRGERRGQFSIWINDPWRLCFRFADGNAYDVEIFDYHCGPRP